MGFFTSQTKVVELDEAHRVTVRKLTYGERQQCLSRAMKVHATPTPGKGPGRQQALDSTELTLDAALLASEQVKAALVSWEGPNFEGRPATGDNLMLLPAEIVDVISRAADELNAGLSAEEKAG